MKQTYVAEIAVIQTSHFFRFETYWTERDRLVSFRRKITSTARTILHNARYMSFNAAVQNLLRYNSIVMSENQAWPHTFLWALWTVSKSKRQELLNYTGSWCLWVGMERKAVSLWMETLVGKRNVLMNSNIFTVVYKNNNFTFCGRLLCNEIHGDWCQYSGTRSIVE